MAGVLLAAGNTPKAFAVEPAALQEAARDPRVDSRLSALLLAGPGSPMADGAKSAYGIPVLLVGPVDRAAVEALGVVVTTEAGGVTTAELPLEAVPGVLALPGIRAIESATPLRPALDSSAVRVGAPTYWNDPTSPYAPPYSNPISTGAGVVVGIVDTGIDPDHDDFKKPTGSTRIKYIWQQIGSGSPPAGFGYGAEWTESQINQGTVTQIDADGHGTFMAGIAAGSGKATGGGFPAYRYVGIAPEADIIVVNTNFFDSKVIDGVNYIFQKATALGKDAVVVLGLGTQKGAHDGTVSLDVALSALTGPGKLIVAAVGNYKAEPIHSSVTLANNASATFTFTIPSYVPQPTIIEGLYIEGWHEPTATFKAKLTSPNGHTTNWINPNATSGPITTPDGILRVTNAMVTNSKGAKQISVDMYDSGTYAPAPGTWQLAIQRIGGTTGKLDNWITSWTFGSNGVAPAFTAYVDTTRVVASPASADSIIGVASYTSKDRWTNGSGGLSLYSDFPVVRAITQYSSPGPRRDGVQRPDLAAPGYGVMAALSTDVLGGTTNTWRAEDLVHRITKFKTGTSAAAAHVAGALALVLQDNPDMKPTVARNWLTQRARSDSFTGAVPNARWGYGKLSLLMGSTAVPGSTTSAESSPSVHPNPASGEVMFDFSLTAQQVADLKGAVQFRIVDVQGREVARLSGVPAVGSQRLVWDGRTGDGAAASPGIYFGRLEGKALNTVWKFVRMR